jgi:hypothetical protein
MAQEQSQAIQNLSPEVKARAMEAGRPAAALMDRATAHHQETTTTHADDRGGKEALMHTQGHPDKAQHSLSPTDSHKSQSAIQQRSQERGRGMER